MLRTAICALFMLAVSGVAHAADGMVTKPSPHSVQDTLDRLEKRVSAKGFTVFVRVDHAAGAKKVGLSLRPTQLLIFGNPKIGTKLMSSKQSIGLDMPIRVAAWEDENGKVWLAYNAPAWMASRHGITDRDAVVQKMTGALGKLTDAATAP